VSKALTDALSCIIHSTLTVSKGKTVTMAELLRAIDDRRVTPRFVRFLIAQSVIPPPRGGRAHAEYGEDHIGGIRRYLRLRELGLSASRVKEVLANSAAGGVPVPLAPGLTLIIDQEKLNGPHDPSEISTRIAEALDLVAPKDV